MIFGWITRRQYLEHHDPERWKVAARRRRQPRVSDSRAARPAPQRARAELKPRAATPSKSATSSCSPTPRRDSPTDQGSAPASQVRDFLAQVRRRAHRPRATFITGFVEQLGLESPAPYAAFMAVIDRDARDAQAAVQLVLAQPAISSQLVDNLNASIHLRALLTDLFLIDEVLKLHARAVR